MPAVCQANEDEMTIPKTKKRKKKRHVPNARIYKREKTDLARPYSQSLMGLTQSLSQPVDEGCQTGPLGTPVILWVSQLSLFEAWDL